MNDKAIQNTAYAELLGTIKARIAVAQYEALKAVNKELIALYWDVGKTIAERQQLENWGKSIVEQLAKDLQSVFPGIGGFSSRNLWYMRTFIFVIQRNQNCNQWLQKLVGRIIC